MTHEILYIPALILIILTTLVILKNHFKGFGRGRRNHQYDYEMANERLQDHSEILFNLRLEVDKQKRQIKKLKKVIKK